MATPQRIALSAYSQLVADAWKRSPVAPAGAAPYAGLVERAAKLLARQAALSEPGFRLPKSASTEQLRAHVKLLMTVRGAGEPGDDGEAEARDAVSELLAAEAAQLASEGALVDVSNFTPFALEKDPERPPSSLSAFERRAFLHRGDITLLSDLHSAPRPPSLGIVNAANSALLGCFRPNHPCIDNAIHCAAGPGLRDACHAYMARFRTQPGGEPVGTAVVTPGFSLLHRGISHVVHTVGPQVPQGRRPSPADAELLASCYRHALDAALEAGLRNLALCSISTGVFGYPVVEATEIAVSTVRDWVEERDLPEGVLDRIIFDVFSERDLDVYRQALSALDSAAAVDGEASHGESDLDELDEELEESDDEGHEHDHDHDGHDHDGHDHGHDHAGHIRYFGQDYVSSLPADNPANIAKAVAILREADAVVIAAGAGLSAAAGLDYTSTSVFRKHFPGMLQYGFRRFYDFIGFTDWPEDGGRLQWGYFLSQVDLAAYRWPRSPTIYGKLFDLAAAVRGAESTPAGSHRPFFVVTTNADNMFLQNGFPEDRIFTPQGSYRLLQCLKPCRPDALFPTSDSISAARVREGGVDPWTMQLRDPSAVPKCPFCGGEVFMNVRGGNWFLEGHLAAQRVAFAEFVERFREEGKKLAVLDIGTGFNTPGVVRLPMERITAAWGDKGWAKLIRINADRWEVPKGLAQRGRAVGIGGDGWGAERVLGELHRGVLGGEVEAES
ncbi:putative ganglioside induced differentiation associated protein [Hyaloraphidium curvatum]|nr:putative ganglioside induced differentiation associated protein [Hyaloraphidium curvatum]